jgi:hypothetical protein
MVNHNAREEMAGREGPAESAELDVLQVWGDQLLERLAEPVDRPVEDEVAEPGKDERRGGRPVSILKSPPREASQLGYQAVRPHHFAQPGQDDPRECRKRSAIAQLSRKIEEGNRLLSDL